jgi:hypothetical protein
MAASRTEGEALIKGDEDNEEREKTIEDLTSALRKTSMEISADEWYNMRQREKAFDEMRAVMYRRLRDIKEVLKEGRVNWDIYNFIRDECDTNTTRQNMVKAFKAFRQARGEEVNKDLTFGKMLEEMKAILDA